MDCWRILPTNEIQAQHKPAVGQSRPRDQTELLKSVRFSVMRGCFSPLLFREFGTGGSDLNVLLK